MMMMMMVMMIVTSNVSNRNPYRMSYESTWSKSKILANNVKQASYPYVCSNEGLRGLGALKSFDKNEVIIELPFDRCLVAPEESNDKSCPDPDLLSIWQNIKGTSRLSLLLLKEYEQQQNSLLYDYIQNLPTPGTLGTPFHWKVEILEAMPYPPLIRAINIQKEQWKKFYSILPGSYKQFSYERFIWSMEIVRSRAFNGVGGLGKSNANLFGGLAGSLLGAAIISSQTAGETIPIVLGGLAVLSLLPAVLESKRSSCVLLPVIDSCNHNSINTLSELALEPNKNSFVVRAKTSIKNGDQVSLSYGDRSNDDLLQYFGFVEIDNPHDSYYILDPIGSLKNALNKENANLPLPKKQAILKAIAELEKTKKPSEAFDDVLTISKKDPLLWSLGSLIYIQEELLDNNDNKSDDEINMIQAMNSSTLKNCLKMMLFEELNRINNYINSNNNNIDEKFSCIIRTFLQEKVKVIDKSIELL